MTMRKYYLYATFLPFGIILPGYILYILYDGTIGPGKDYKSEWLTAGSVYGIVIVAVTLHCLLVCLLSLPIALNKYPKINTSFALSFLSWFLFPMIYLGYLLLLLCKGLLDGEHDTDSILFILSLTLPFIASLCWTFILFRRKFAMDRSLSMPKN
jgi:hypothetical protein